jgi:4-hydroxyphenylpyruvate dioxygenase-like putative hemolysin
MAGTVQIELVQVLEGETVYDDFIRDGRYGLHHLGIRTDNIDESIKKFAEKGIAVTQSGNRPSTKWAYLDTKEETDIIFELIEKDWSMFFKKKT